MEPQHAYTIFSDPVGDRIESCLELLHLFHSNIVIATVESRRDRLWLRGLNGPIQAISD